MTLRPAVFLTYAVTISRVPLAALLILSFERPLLPQYLLLLAIVLSDVFDGALARSLGIDDNRRRITDATVDRLAMHSVFVGFFLTFGPAWVVLYLPILARDLVCLTASGWLIRRQGLLVLGDGAHKLSSLACAAFGAALVAEVAPLIVSLGLVAIATNVVLALDYAGTAIVALERIDNPRSPATRAYCDHLEGVKELAIRWTGTSEPARS